MFRLQVGIKGEDGTIRTEVCIPIPEYPKYLAITTKTENISNPELGEIFITETDIGKQRIIYNYEYADGTPQIEVCLTSSIGQKHNNHVTNSKE